jgi:L-alanine-DL-glutamate epimerase-like enolase superfamily enzyme
MKIRSASVIRCPPRWLLLRLESSDGEVGWGEAIGDLHEEVEPALKAMCDRVSGTHITGIERIKQEMHK